MHVYEQESIVAVCELLCACMVVYVYVYAFICACVCVCMRACLDGEDCRDAPKAMKGRC